jgi:hypothetical protein
VFLGSPRLAGGKFCVTGRQNTSTIKTIRRVPSSGERESAGGICDLSSRPPSLLPRPLWLSSLYNGLAYQGQHKRPIAIHNSETSFCFKAMDVLTIKGDMRRRRKNIHASELARRRWSKVPKNERAKQVPRSGGRPRKYPKCPRYGSHRFSPRTGRCPCGFARPVHR